MPGLAASVTPVAGLNFTRWVIKLRPGLKFTDGTDFTVDAIVAHWERVRNPSNASRARADALLVDKTKVIDPLTLEVSLSEGDSTWNQMLAGALGSIPSPTAVKAAGDAAYGTTPQTVVGAGPFRLTELVRGDHYTFDRNPQYYDASKPYLDKVIMRPVTNPDTRGNTFKSGAADVVAFLTPTQQIVDLRNAKFANQTVAGGAISAPAIRTDTGPTADVRVREALQRAIDIDAVIARAAPGAEATGTTLQDPKGPYTNNVAYPSFDRAQAQALIDAYGKDTGQSTARVNVIGAESSVPVWEAFKQEWSKIRGLDVTLQIESSTATSTRIATGNFNDLLGTSVPLSPRAAKPVFTIGSPQNITRIKDSALDTAIGDASVTDDIAQQRRALEKVAARLTATVPYVLQYRQAYNWFWQKDVKGLSTDWEFGVIRMQNVWKS